MSKEIENKKRFLKQYRYNKACIIRLEDKLDNLDSRITSLQSPSISDMPRGGSRITNEDLIADKVELQARIQRLKKKGRFIKAKILNELDKLTDARLCEVLELYFIDDLSFYDIASEMGYHERTIIRFYTQAINELVRLDDMPAE